jgi:hypothetical protein
MYLVLDKKKPGIRLIRGLNLAAVRPTTIQLSAVSEKFHKLRHNLLHGPELTGNLCITCINVTQYSAVTEGAQSP